MGALTRSFQDASALADLRGHAELARAIRDHWKVMAFRRLPPSARGYGGRIQRA